MFSYRVYDTNGPYSIQSSASSIPHQYGSYTGADMGGSPPVIFTTSSSLTHAQINQSAFYDGT